MVDPGAGIPQYTLNRIGGWGGVIFKYKDEGGGVKYSNVRTRGCGEGQGLNICINTKGGGFKCKDGRVGEV